MFIVHDIRVIPVIVVVYRVLMVCHVGKGSKINTIQ